MTTIYIPHVAMINALGYDLDIISQHLMKNQPYSFAYNEQWLMHHRPAYVGEINKELPQLPEHLKCYNTRNNQLLLACLHQIKEEVNTAIAQYGLDRIAVIIGTSTSGIDEGQKALKAKEDSGQFPDNYYYQHQELGNSSEFIANYLGISGPAYTISTACSSSSRAIISGQRLLRAGLADVAIVGGADTLCQLSINGFDSLASLSSSPCKPFAENRNGINIGEAGCLMVLTKTPSNIALLGFGESSDAYHISAPHKEGLGAEQAMRNALACAKLTATDIGYINLHGTATPLNDEAEALAVHRVFGDNVPCSSTKHLTGHTLGAAGATEAGIAWLLLDRDLSLPFHDFSKNNKDPNLAAINLLQAPEKIEKPAILSNSFAFGGNNTSLIIGKI